MCERHRLLNQIRMCDFALTEVVLYLDSHPFCQKGLAYYQKHRQMRDEAAAAYQAQFGPLNIRSNNDPDRYTELKNLTLEYYHKKKEAEYKLKNDFPI